ncbi:transferase family protein, partial [Cryphonectria parasitica EP155]
SSPTTRLLSIADATTARFAICGAVWLYDASPASQDPSALANRLETSLRHSLNDFRHLAGSLSWAPPDTRHPAYPRYGRPQITWNSRSDGGGGCCGADPGVEFSRAHYDAPLASIVPSDEERRTTRKVWLATGFPQNELLLPDCDLAFVSSLSRFEGLPVAGAQVTTFACGGWAVGVKITHCLSDAVGLVNFVKAWAEETRLLGSASSSSSSSSSTTTAAAAAAAQDGATMTTTRSIFNPSLLDQHAGDIDQPEPDANKIALARSLPLFRFDWWDTEAPGYPSWATADTQATRPSDEELRHVKLSPGTRPPWPTWDISKPADHVQIRFSAEEVLRLKQTAQASVPQGEGAHDAHTISRLDALLAHVWIHLTRARQLHLAPDNDEPVYMAVTLGLRSRVNPPLPDTFAGSPILLGHASLPGRALSSGTVSLGEVALALRRTMARFTPEAVGAYLHDAAYEVCPQRLWQAFCGSRYCGVTSWTRSGAYGVDFVGALEVTGGDRPRYVHCRMPLLDGILQVLDVGETGDLDVSLALGREEMGRLL